MNVHALKAGSPRQIFIAERAGSLLPTVPIPGSWYESRTRTRFTTRNRFRIGRPLPAGREREGRRNLQTEDSQEQILTIMSPKTIFNRIPAFLRPNKNPHNDPHNLKYLQMKQRPLISRCWSAATNRLGWAALFLVISLCLPFVALYFLIFGTPEDDLNPIEAALEKWMKDRNLDGWYFADPKHMEDSLRIDAITASTRKENCFVSFLHPITGNDTVIGIAAEEGSAAAYELVNQSEDPDRQVLRFMREFPSFQNEAQLLVFLDSQLQNERTQ